MKSNALSWVLIAVSSLPACLATGCTSGGHLADGTETGNPEITACVKKMAQLTFNALDSGNSWKPDDFLHAQTGIALAKAPAQVEVKPEGLRKTQSIKSDTVIISDSVEIVYDTMFVVDTIHVTDTVKINKVLFVSDTVVDTVLSVTGNDVLYNFVRRQVQDSVTVIDNVVVADTIIQQRKKVIIKICQYREGLPVAFIRADSLWIANSKVQTIGGKNVLPLNEPPEKFVLPIKWDVASVTYDIATASTHYSFVSDPRKDTMVISGTKGGFSVISSQGFMERTKIVNGLVIEKERYDRPDSILNVMRYYPLAIDSVESLSVAYSIDPGANTFSGSDDRLLRINRKVLFRLGMVHFMNVALTPEAPETYFVAAGRSNAAVSIFLENNRCLHGIFNGTVDATGLTGVYEFSGRKYQVRCDRGLNAIIAKVKD